MPKQVTLRLHVPWHTARALAGVRSCRADTTPTEQAKITVTPNRICFTIGLFPFRKPVRHQLSRWKNGFLERGASKNPSNTRSRPTRKFARLRSISSHCGIAVRNQGFHFGRVQPKTDVLLSAVGRGRYAGYLAGSRNYLWSRRHVLHSSIKNI